MDKTQILRAFNDHFIELVDDVIRVFPDNDDIKTLKTAFVQMRKANPKLILTAVKSYVLVNYRSEIEAGNLSFFIEKDYSYDLSSISNSKYIISKIEQLRNSIRQMNESDKKNVVKYR